MAKISRQVVVRIRSLAILLLLIMVLATTGPHAAAAMSGLPQVAFSRDGTPISYEVW
jgi:hypothetical protein